MALQEALVVPVEVEALVVNDSVRQKQSFLRWQMRYGQLQSFSTPEPRPFEAPTDFNTEAKNNGVYLQWTLPDALRRGDTGSGGETAEFPLVPNRWLVVRHSGPKGKREACGWVVESDYLDPDDGTSPFLANDASGKPTATLIGRKVEIGPSGWSERSSHFSPFLRAVAPGLPSFAAYQPYNEDVFSIHDSLAGVSVTDPLAYLVVGWFSDPTRDPLAKGEWKKRLDELGWAVEGADTAGRSVYCGSVHGVAWEPGGPAPAGRKPEPKDVSLAIGPTTIDALTALVDRQDAGSLDAEALEAFQHGVIDLLDEPDGPQELERRVHDAAFSLGPGGFAWEIVDAPGAETSPDQEELEKEERWLAELNAHQAEYDEAARVLRDKQRRLYETWWLAGKAAQMRKKPTGLEPEVLAEWLDPGKPDGIAHETATQAAQVEELGKKVPAGATETELAAAIEAFAQQQTLRSSRQLKRVGKQPFAQANDPVLLLAGTKSEGLLAPEALLPCRLPSQLVSELRFGTGIKVAKIEDAIPAPDLANVPAVAAKLLAETFLLDPLNAGTLARVALGSEDAATVEKLEAAIEKPDGIVEGTLPAFGVSAWTQPWSPLYLLWEIDYYPAPYKADSAASRWSFDGTAYSWGGKASEPVGYMGRTLLTPQAVFNLRAQIARYEEHHPDAELEKIADFIATTDRWDLLSQTLGGLGATMVLRDPSTRPAAPAPVGSLSAGADFGAPMPGAATADFGEWPSSDFQQLRAGQFAFTRVTVVDRFGQELEVVNEESSADLKPTLAPSLKPQQPVLDQSPARFAQLPPRLLQAARLRLDLVSATTDELTEQSVGANPICAWLLPNHLDGSFLLFAPAGEPLGELRVVSDENGQSLPFWDATPGSQYEEVSQLSSAFPHLASFLEYFTVEPNSARAADLRALQSAVDATLATIEPPGGATEGSLAVLVGRPLCLVRAQAQLELDGPPIADPSWQFAMNQQPSAPAFTAYEFPVRLGETGRLGDGLVGYFVGKDYGSFDAVQLGSAVSDYVKAIGPDNFVPLSADAQQPTYLTLLQDPLAPVHAVSDLLPVASLQLPPALLRAPLAALAPTFRVGPVLSTTHEVPGKEPSVVMPRPALRKGTWSWAERVGGGDWSTAAVENADQTARLPVAPVARNGLLRLSDDQDQGR